MSEAAAVFRAADISNSIRRRGVIDPPDFIIDEGIAALAPGTLRARGWYLGQHLLIQCETKKSLEKAFQNLQIANEEHKYENKRIIIVKAWPLRNVPSDVVALNHASLKVLGFKVRDGERKVISPRREKTLSGGKKRKRQGRDSVDKVLGSETPSLPRLSAAPKKGRPIDSISAKKGLRPNETAADTVEIQALLPEDISEAKCVAFVEDSARIPNLNDSEVLQSLLHRAVLGRVLALAMVVEVTLLGVVLDVRVEKLQCEGSDYEVFGLISDATNLSVRSKTSRNNPMGDKRLMGGATSTLENIGGLDREIQLIKELLSISLDTRASQYAACPRGLLLHGPSGSGKTLLAEAIAKEAGVEIEIIRGSELISPLLGESESALSSIFARAYSKAPCVVVVDSVDAIAVRRDAPTSSAAQQRLTSTLLTLMDGIVSRKGPLFVIGTTSRVDILDAAARRPGRFDREIEIPVPNAQARSDILHCISSTARKEGLVSFSEKELERVAYNAYGLVGADLEALWRETVLEALSHEDGAGLRITLEDLQRAAGVIKPSALREVATQIPSVRWDDIGGKEEVKQRLKEAVEWPLSKKGSAMFQAIGIRPPRGVLLFGPPGCSKTLLAKAVATESGANFISIKGPELLSKYVGESEKAVRATFRKARAASPCVVFFDEIDALATSRSSPSASSAESRVLAQLLTELDGIDAPLSTGFKENHVVVIAATNRPDLLDSALLRPGRMDRLLYIGLPNESERLSILNVCCRGVPIGTCVNLMQISQWPQVKGMSGAELAALVREAALSAMEEDVDHADCVRARHFEVAASKVRKGTSPEQLQFYRQYMKNVRGVLLDDCDWYIDSKYE